MAPDKLKHDSPQLLMMRCPSAAVRQILIYARADAADDDDGQVHVFAGFGSVHLIGDHFCWGGPTMVATIALSYEGRRTTAAAAASDSVTTAFGTTGTSRGSPRGREREAGTATRHKPRRRYLQVQHVGYITSMQRSSFMKGPRCQACAPPTSSPDVV